MYPLLDDSLIRKDKSEDAALLLSASRWIIFRYSALAVVYILLFGVISTLIFLPDLGGYFLTQEVFTVYALVMIAAAMCFTAWYTSLDIAKTILQPIGYIGKGFAYFFRIWISGLVGFILSFFLLNEATGFWYVDFSELIFVAFVGLIISIIAGPIILYLSKDKIEKTFEID